MGEKELKAINLRYEGQKYEKIANVVGVSLATVKNWFSSSGRLQNAYRDFEKERNSALKEEALLNLKKSVGKATKTLVQLLDSNNPTIRLRAATAILEREFGKAEAKDEGKMSVVELMREAQREKELANNL